jgi:hypothetical protein
MKAGFKILTIGLAASVAIIGQKPALAAGHPVLAELFTSQSCSSCPPADALLGELAQRPDVLVLSFHIDYWDRLGWKDPFSLRAATERQRHYADVLHAEVYTPQLVVDGQSEAVGSDRRSVETLLQRDHGAMTSAAIRDSNGASEIRIGASPSFDEAVPAEILLVTFDPIHKTRVQAGENEGRYLTTYNDVRSLRVVGAWNGAPVALQVASSENRVGARAAVIVQSRDGKVWALAATETTAAE